MNLSKIKIFTLLFVGFSLFSSGYNSYAKELIPSDKETQATAMSEDNQQEKHDEQAGVLGTLGIDLKLFIAQLINFGIILLILWKWVLNPVAKKLTERSDRIEKSLKDAQNTENEKNEFAKWKEIEMTKVRSQAQGIIVAAENDANKAKEKIMQSAKAEQERTIQQTREQIEHEKQNAIKEVKSQMADLVVLATERIIKEKLDSKKDQEFIRKTISSVSN